MLLFLVRNSSGAHSGPGSQTSQSRQEAALGAPPLPKAQRNRAVASPGVGPTRRLRDCVYFEGGRATHPALRPDGMFRERHAAAAHVHEAAADLPPPPVCCGRDLAQGPSKTPPPTPHTPSPLSFQIYLTLAHWRFIIHLVQTHGRRITHFKPHCEVNKARVTDQNHLWSLLGCVNSLL